MFFISTQTLNTITVLIIIIQVVERLVDIYSFIVFGRVMLSWFPNIDWSNRIISTITSITDPFLEIFQGIVPPIGNIDLSPIASLFFLQVSQKILNNAIYNLTTLTLTP